MNSFLVLFLTMTSVAQAALVKKSVDYNLVGKKYEGFVAYDDTMKGPRPGILVAHDWMGITDRTKAKVEELAGMGYVAFAVDIYGKGTRPANAEEAGKLAGFYKKDRLALRARMQAGLKTLRDQAQVDKTKLIAIGYCFGGTAALELGRAGAELRDIVTFHGGLDSPKPDDGKNIKAKVLALHGADDPFVSASDLTAFENEMRKGGVDWQLIKYGGAVHSFTDKSAGSDPTKGAAYNAEADRRSWQAFKDLLAETGI
jgi:dienelactone hydrolase